MPNLRLWTTDEQGNDVLHTTIVLDNKLNTKEVIHHSTDEQRAEQRTRNTQRVKRAVEELAMQNPKAVLEVYGEDKGGKINEQI